MNKEIIKAMNKKPKKYAFREWWSNNSYKVNRIIFFPIWIGSVVAEKINKYLDSREAWSEERAKAILDYYIPRSAEWDNEAKQFYYFDNGYGWSLSCAKRYLKRKDRRWWERHNGFSGGKIRDYLMFHYELEGFKKEVFNASDDTWTEICFTMKI